MPQHTGYMQNKVSPLRKLRGKKISAQEARQDLFTHSQHSHKHTVRHDAVNKAAATANLRSSSNAATAVSLRERLRTHRAGTPWEHIDFSAVRLAHNNKNSNKKSNKKNDVSRSLTTEESEKNTQTASTASWVTYTYSASTKCSEQPTYASFVAANQCMQAVNSTDSFSFTGDQYQVFYKVFYNSDDCTGSDVAMTSLPLGCVDGVQYAFSWEPANSNPLPSLGSYATYTYYDEEGCQGKKLNGDGILNQVCISDGFGSTFVDYPTIYEYSDSACDSIPTQETTESKTCANTTVDDDYSFNLPYERFELLSGSPFQPQTDPEGYLVLAYDLGEECSDVPDEIMGFALDTCQIDADLQTSYKFTCSDEYAYKYVYLSGDCDTNTQAFIERFTLGCETHSLDGSGTYFRGNYSLHALCSEGSSMVIPGNARYGINKYFEVDNCAGHPISYYGYPENTCLSYTEDASYSYKLDYPYFYEYVGLGCTGNSTIVDAIANSSYCVGMSPYLSSGDDNGVIASQSVPTYYNQFPEGLYLTGTVAQGHAISTDSSSSAAVLDSTGIAGVIVGGIIGLALLAGGALFYAIHRNKNKSEEELELSEQL